MTGTTNLNLTKPTVGGDSDAWGGELNTDLDTLDALLQGVIYGLTLSAAGSTATFGVAAGAASGMALASAFTKTASSWALGTGNGSLDTGAIANATWYHVWLIQRSDTGVVDILTSLSASSPTMPTNYDRKRRIGSMLTDGSAHWVKFSQIGNEFLWTTPVAEWASVTPPDTSAHLKNMTAPTGIQVVMNLDVELDYDSAASIIYISSPDQDDVAASASAFNLAVSSVLTSGQTRLAIRTSTLGQIRVRASNIGCHYFINSNGWTDRRGQ